MSERVPLYTFDKGLEIDVSRFNFDGSFEASLKRISAIDLQRHRIDEVGYSKAQAELDNKSVALATTTGTQRGVEYAILNDDLDDEGSVYVYQYPWGGSFNNPLGTLEAQTLATKYPGDRFLLINSPGAGGTDRLPSPVSKEVAKSGSFIASGEFYVKALGRVLANYDKIHFRGNSLGARNMIGFAAAYERDIESLVVTDPVGSQPLSIRDITKAMLRELSHSAKYVESSNDQVAKKAIEGVDNLGDMLSALKSGAALDQFLRQPSAMRKPGLEGDLAIAMEKVRSTVMINTPELSEYTDPGKVESMLGRLATSVLRPATIEHRIMRGHTHLYHDGNPGAHAYIIRSLEVA